jgi:hypothetical protein
LALPPFEKKASQILEMEFRLNFVGDQSMSLTPNATGNSSSLADHHGLKIFTPIHHETEDYDVRYVA